MNPEDEILDEVIAILSDIVQSGEEISDDLLSLLEDLIVGTSLQPTPIETPVPAGAELIWILSGSNPRIFRSYLQTFPDPEMNALARNPEQLQQVISRLSRQITQEHPVSEEGIPAATPLSSNIFGFKYNLRTKQLFVKFQGNDNYGGGPVYEYENVPPNVFKMFASGAGVARTNGQNKWGRWWRGKSPTLGGAFWNLIRDRYPYQRVA